VVSVTDPYGRILGFLDRVLHPAARILSRSLEEPSIATTLQGVYFILYIISPLHVSALAGHLQAEYPTILGSYLTTDPLFCVMGLSYCLANTAVVFFNMCL
jgi:hypothetical protein